jgi:hypothetical protein
VIGYRSAVTIANRSSAHPGFEATARAADGTIEAIEDPERPVLAGRAVASREWRRLRPLSRLIEAASGVERADVDAID